MLQTVKAAHVWITFYLHVSLLLICCQVSSLFWSRRVALWIGRQLFKQRTKVQALLLASIRLTEAAVRKKKRKKKGESLPVCTWVSALTSLREDKQSTGTMINERSDYYLISAIGSQDLSPWVCVCFFSFFFFFLNPCGIFIMSPEQNFDLSPSEHFTV